MLSVSTVSFQSYRGFSQEFTNISEVNVDPPDDSVSLLQSLCLYKS